MNEGGFLVFPQTQCLQIMKLNIKKENFLFAVMPWAYPDTPVLGPSLLKSILTKAGYRSQVIYPIFEMFVKVEPVFYYSLSNDHSLFELSEHLFSCYVHGKDNVKSDIFLNKLQEEHIEHKIGKNYLETLIRLRDSVIPDFIDELAGRIIEQDIPGIGFSCTYNQIMGSLAVAKRIKERKSDVRTIFGGPSLSGQMGITHHQKYLNIIDNVYLGEADEYIVEIVKKIISGEKLLNIPGLTVCLDGIIETRSNAIITQRLDDLPTPDFIDYFQQRSAFEEDGVRLPNTRPLPYESSRGCSWAEKMNCSFCGFNGLARQYRLKSPFRVVSELDEISTTYANLDFSACDNNLDNSYFDTFFPLLTNSDIDYSIWYQIRSNIQKKNVSTMKKGKVTFVHAGIESFSDNILKLMRKGVTYLENIQLLKWCREEGIKVSYMVLWGIPGETPDDYEKMAELVPLIMHLDPPLRLQFVELHRFSPMFNEPEKFGIQETYLRENYIHVYPENILEPNLLYFFQFYSPKTEKAGEYTTSFREAVTFWSELHSKNDTSPLLEMRAGKDFLLIHDNRFGEGLKYFLDELQKEIILLGDSIQKISTIYDLLIKKWPDLSKSEIENEIETLKNNGLIIVEKNKYLSLPIKVHL